MFELLEKHQHVRNTVRGFPGNEIEAHAVASRKVQRMQAPRASGSR